MEMNWVVLFHDEFALEFVKFPRNVQKRMLAKLKVIEQFGAELGRPHVCTLKGSQYTNMKELRFEVNNGV